MDRRQNHFSSPKQEESFVFRAEVLTVLLVSEEHAPALASQCADSCVQQSSGWFCVCSSPDSHTQQGRINPQIGKTLCNHGERQIATVKEVLLCDVGFFSFWKEVVFVPYVVSLD